MSAKKKKQAKIELIGDRTGKFLDAISAIVEPSELTVKLYNVSDIEVFKSNANAYNLIAKLINYNTRQHAYLATIFNAIFTQKTDCFMLSRRYMEQLLESETNHEFNKINNIYYGPLLTNLTEGEINIADRLVEQEGRCAAFYRLNKKHPVYAILCELISEDFLEMGFDYKTKWYEDYRGKMLGSKKQGNSSVKLVDKELLDQAVARAKKMKGEL